MGFHLAILLTLGILAASSASLLIANAAQRRTLQRLRLESVVNSSNDIVQKLDKEPALTEELLGRDLILGARFAPPGARLDRPDEPLTAMLRSKFGGDAAGQIQSRNKCFPMHFAYDETVFDITSPVPDCWLIRFRDRHGRLRLISIGLPRFLTASSERGAPAVLVFALIASAILASSTAYFATKPLRRLTRAAEAFSLSDEPQSLPETGPSEVRTAIATFNMMQRRVTEGHRERTSMLAAIGHDLQTPLTRLRLRLDEVADETLRARLVADLSNTQSLVRDGLDLARSSENREAWSIVDLDSLIESLAADALEMGAAVTVGPLSGMALPIKLDALTRCLSNLIDNAIKYGGCAKIECRHTGHLLDILVHDEGPGIPDALIARMFDPFVRGDQSRSRSTGGTGIGLTIARAQAKLFGGEVCLRNHPDGGLVAIVRINIAHGLPNPDGPGFDRGRSTTS